MKITGTVKSEKGFYIGDICYALNEDVYDNIWGGTNYEDGVHTEPVTGCSFAVAGTAYGDGTYHDDQYRGYSVDAGNIGLVAGELVEDSDGGHYFKGAGTAIFEAENGHFEITLPGGETIIIETGDVEEEDDYYEEDEDYDYYEDSVYEEEF